MSRDTRLWMYRPGEARLFEHPDHVPNAEGWRRFPIHRHCERSEAIQGQVSDAALDSLGAKAPRDDTKGAPTPSEKLDAMTRQELMQVARECGVRFAFNWSKAQLKEAILEAVNGNGA